MLYGWMRRWWVGPLLGLVTVFVAAEKPTTQDWSAVPRKTAESVVPVVSSDGEHTGYCTGVVLAKDVVLTAAHCLHSIPSLLKDGELHPGSSVAVDGKDAEVLRANTVLDLALLKVRGLGGTGVPIRITDVAVGMPVAVGGYAFGSNTTSWVFGWVSNLRNEQITVGVFFDMTLIPGHSGGPIFDQQGFLVSMAQGFVSLQGQGLGVGSTPKTLRDFVSDFLPNQIP